MDIVTLKNRRTGHKGRVTYFKNILDSNPDLSTGELQSMLHRLRFTYSKFDEVQSSIENLDTDGEDNERDTFEDNYGKLESQILNQIDKLEQKANWEPKPTSINIGKSTEDSSVNTTVAIKLPEILLPKFDGFELSWLNFRDVFSDLIHNNRKLDETTKFHYLISCVRDGKAFHLIEALPVTNKNYQTAWTTIYDHFNNEIRIQKLHMKSIYDIKKPMDGSAQSLKIFIDTVLKHLNALKSLNIPIDEWNLFIIHHLSEKLDSASLTQVIKSTAQNAVLKFTEFIDILKKRVQILESVKQSSISSNQASSNSDNKFKKPNIPKHTRSFVSNEFACIFCNGTHTLANCPKFTAPNFKTDKRFDFVKKHHLCTNCLSDNHRVFDCKSGPCSLCALKHNILLHFSRNSSYLNSKNSQPSSQSHPHNVKDSVEGHVFANKDVRPGSTSTNDRLHCANTSVYTSNVDTKSNYKRQILLATVIVWVRTPEGCQMKCRALLDSGSQSNFITERICQSLKIRKTNVSIPVASINQNTIHIRHSVDLNIKSRISDFSRDLQFLVLPKITGYLPSEQIKFDINSIPNSIELADPYFFKPDKIDLLIGAEIYHEAMLNDKIEIVKDLPAFISTVFGYIVSGKINEINTNDINQTSSYVCFHTSFLEELNSNIERFWQIEELEIKNNFSMEEKECEEHYKENVTRDSTGRYSIALPVKPNITQLGQSSHNALKQFQYLEQKLIKNPETYIEYVKFMADYIKLGHMKEVLNVNHTDNLYNKVYYLPHHSVIKENSTTTKLRVVFNASSKTSTNLSLNDCLMTGPKIQQDLFCIVLRFRKYPIAFTGDIAKMYRQIQLHGDQQDLHRIWWRDSPKTAIKCYRLCTVTYGTASAPFLATRTLNQLAADESSKYPEASVVLGRDFYVDDVLSGANTIVEALALKSDLVKLLGLGGFELRKFASNSDQLVSNEENLEKTISVLGMPWNSKNDTFDISFVKHKANNDCTKRKVLSEIAQLYDPLGLCAPIIFLAKLFMQSLWATPNLSWDDKIPQHMIVLWNEFKGQISKLRTLHIPRCVIPSAYKIIELHAFGDASEKGFGCVVYIRIITEFNKVSVRLLCAKSRVAPLKSQTIPRLELCAALLVAQLTNKVIEILNIQFNSIFLWSDSEITLLRIKSQPSRFATFVANRVSQVQELTVLSAWRYVPSQMNPADLVSRGLMPQEIKNSSLWWNGPDFLYEAMDNWPLSPNSHISPELLELRKTEISLICTKQDWDLLNKFSNFKKLLRVTATCLRFLNNCKTSKENRKYGQLHSSEIDNALKRLVKYIQSIEYIDEIKQLRKYSVVSTKSKIKSLSPFLDESDILRVGGRLMNADIHYDNQHQILLPGSHTFTKLLIIDRHCDVLHAGPQALLYNLRLQFWITGGRNLCRQVVRECIRCVRAKPPIISQIMGQLPADRVNSTTPFNSTGVDLCGPFYLIYNTRSKVKQKVYIAIFVCFAVKAVHMEIVVDLSTQSFLSALRRFTSRRGRCAHLYSDNATNFIGARTELKELHQLFMSEMHQKEVFRFCSDQGIEWQTIPPRSPHFGGLWEAAVKSAKFHLKRVIGQSTYIIDEFHTLVTQVEACLNSRPISPMSDDPSDMSPLTPGHFLIGKSLNAIPEPSLDHLKFNRLSRYQRMQALLQQFWLRWSKEYLCELQSRGKWLKPTTEIKIGSLVLLHEDNIPPMRWIMARITQIHLGKDGHVRVVTVKTANSEFKRAITRISFASENRLNIMSLCIVILVIKLNGHVIEIILNLMIK